MDCKDGHIQDLAEEMEELWRLLREAVQENDDLQCALENCKQSLESHLDSSNAVQMHVTELQRLMDSFRKQSCVPIKMQHTMTPSRTTHFKTESIFIVYSRILSIFNVDMCTGSCCLQCCY